MHVGVVPSEDGDTEVRPLMSFERKRSERESGLQIMDGSFCFCCMPKFTDLSCRMMLRYLKNVVFRILVTCLGR